MHFRMSSVIQDSSRNVYAWHEKPGSFFRLIPPWEDVDVIVPPSKIENGSEVVTQIKVGPMSINWVGRHYDVQPGVMFCDEIIEGPFSSWKHQHIFEDQGNNCQMTDSIDYQLPMGPIGTFLGESFTANKIRRLFTYRHTIVKNDFHLQKKYPHKKKAILITGGSGMIGRALIPLLKNLGHDVYRLGRNRDSHCTDPFLIWNFQEPLDIASFGIDRFDSVIHLAGENIAGARWTQSQKRRILQSRQKGTELLAKAISKMPIKPSSFICASASGFYPENKSEFFDESAPAGKMFLSTVCQEWEKACDPARHANIRTVNLRIGIVLTPRGGALKKMLAPFQAGLGAPLGTGEQFWSWVSIDDLLGQIIHSLESDSLDGPVNAVSPHPVTNRVFSKLLAQIIEKPLLPAVPRFALKLLAGGMSDELLLASRKIHPKALSDSKYEFYFPELEGALRHLLGRTDSRL